MSLVQREYGRYPGLGHIGDLARPSEPHAFDIGLAQVPTNGRKPRPGDCVYYDAANNGFAVPTTEAQRRAAIGVVSYDPGVVQGRLASVPSGANSDMYVEFEDGEEIKVCVLGTVWVVASTAMEYGQLVQQTTFGATPDYEWDAYDPDLTVDATFANLAAARSAVNDVVEELRRRTFECVSPTPVAADGLAQVRIGYGRIV